jgi:hypothetical protein
VDVTRALLFVVATALVGCVAGCGGDAPSTSGPRVGSRIIIPADNPPSPATWPPYPHFTQASCWGRPVRGAPMRWAPSYAVAKPGHPVTPQLIVRRFLARFGDRRYIRAITFPARGDSERLVADIHAPLVRSASTTSDRLGAAIASWEARLAFGALRDDFCSAGGPALSRTIAGADAGGWAQENYALEQRFPNPTPAAFKQRLALVARRYGFHVVELRLLHPEQIAPLLVVKTNRNRERFSRDVGTIEQLLDPSTNAHGTSALTFEGFFFAAEDAKGLFLSTEGVDRGTAEGGQWAAAENLYPYVHG